MHTPARGLRIGFDITALYIAQAGIFTYDLNLLRALLALDRQSQYLLLDYRPIHGRRTGPPELDELHAPNVQVVHGQGLRARRLSRWRPLENSPLQGAARWADRTLLWPWSAAAEAVMRRRLAPLLDGLDVFHSSEVLLWRQPGARNVVTLYDLTALLFPEYHTAETRERQQRKYRFAQEQADVVIAISEATKRDVVTHLGIPPERVQVVYGGVGPLFRPLEDRRAVAEALAPLGLVPGGYLLHVGRIEPRKNLVRLVEAYGRVRRALPALPPLALVGAPGWQSRELFRRIAALGLEREVRFVGPVETALLPALYNGAFFFAYPSLYEGFGLPVLEALACGTPVLASNTSSLPEIVGDAGVLVEPTDVAALAEAIVELLRDEARRESLRAAGPPRAARFTWEAAARRVRSLYEPQITQITQIGRIVV